MEDRRFMFCGEDRRSHIYKLSKVFLEVQDTKSPFCHLKIAKIQLFFFSSFS